MVVATQVSVFGLYRPPLLSKGDGGSAEPPQTIISSPLQTPVKSARPSGAFIVLVAVQLSVPGLYLPPVFKTPSSPAPPQIIISLPVQTAAWRPRASGALVMLVAVQLFVLGLYLPPVLNS